MTKEFTGRKFLFVMIAAFAVIIGANIALAVAAIGTFPGLEVANSYVASQNFEAERAEQERLGWRADVRYEDGRLFVAVRDRDGTQVELSDLTVKVGRPTGQAVDHSADFRLGAADLDLAPGLWRIDVFAKGRNGEHFRQHLNIEVAG